MNCPCKSNLSYDACCKPYHDGSINPETPEKLMRSRYSAYALKKIDYIMKTTDRKGPLFNQDKPAWEDSLKSFAQMTSFQNLTILDKEDLSEDEGTVTFRAQLMSLQGEDVSFTEKSLFKKRDGNWYYHSRI